MTNDHFDQLFHLRSKVNHRVSQLSSQPPPSDDLYLLLTRLLGQKALVPIHTDDVWTTHFRESGKYHSSPEPTHPKLESFLLDEPEEQEEDSNVMLPKI